MSNVSMLKCPICNPEAADQLGIRHTVVATSTELFDFVRHYVDQHWVLPVAEAKKLWIEEGK